MRLIETRPPRGAVRVGNVLIGAVAMMIVFILSGIAKADTILPDVIITTESNDSSAVSAIDITGNTPWVRSTAYSASNKGVYAIIELRYFFTIAGGDGNDTRNVDISMDSFISIAYETFLSDYNYANVFGMILLDNMVLHQNHVVFESLSGIATASYNEEFSYKDNLSIASNTIHNIRLISDAEVVNGFASAFVDPLITVYDPEYTIFFSPGVNNLKNDIAPVPEPTTILLFGTGLAGLAAVGRRKRD